MQNHGESEELSRRTVLRRGAIAAGAATVGVPALSGSASASDCPRTPGFWATHDWCAVDTNPDDDEPVPEDSVAASLGLYNGEGDCPDQGAEYCLEQTGVCRTMSEWRDFLTHHPRGDTGVIMGQTLLATVLNYQRRPSTDDTCVDRRTDFSEYGLEETTTVREVRRRAEDWLAASNFPASQRQWTVDGVDGEPLKNVLDAFNNGQIESLDCDCTRRDNDLVDGDVGGDAAADEDQDLVDADALSQSEAGADQDLVDADVLDRSEAGGDDDFADADVLGRPTAESDEDFIDADALSRSEANNGKEVLDLDIDTDNATIDDGAYLDGVPSDEAASDNDVLDVDVTTSSDGQGNESPIDISLGPYDFLTDTD
jgi:hypothetical protein